MSKFAIGDRVVAITHVDGMRNLVGKSGTVVGLHVGSFDVVVEFDEAFLGGHNCHGLSKDGYGRFGYDDNFELLESVMPEHIISFDEMLSEVCDG